MTQTALLITNCLLSVLLVVILVPLFIRWSIPLGLMKDHKPLPGSRERRVVPLVGGAVIFLVWLLTFVVSDRVCEAGFPFDPVQARGLLLGSLIVFLMGLKDDMGDLDYKLRLVIQTGAALILVVHGFQLDAVTVPFVGTVDVGWVGNILFVIWVVTVTNAINLIDGLDGLAAGITAISLFFIGILTVASDVFVGYVAINFAIILMTYLKYAWYPAKTFLGNSGSFLIGFLLAVLSFKASLKGTIVLSLFIPLLLIAVPLFDMVRLVLTRSLAGRNPFRSDHAHLHYLLLSAGLKHPDAVACVFFLSFSFGFLGFLMTLLNPGATIIAFLIGLVLFFLSFRAVKLFRNRA